MTTKTRAPKRTFTETRDHRVGTLTVGKLTASFVRIGDQLADVTFDGMGPADHANMLGMVLQSAAVRWDDCTDLFDALNDRSAERGRAHGDLLFDLGEVKWCEDGTVEAEILLGVAADPNCYTTIVLRGASGTTGIKCTAEPMEPAQLWAVGSLLCCIGQMMTDGTLEAFDLSQVITHHFTGTLGAESLNAALADGEDDL